MKKFRQIITEAAYPGNLGAIEMMKFYQLASNDEIKNMEKIAKSNNWKAFKVLIKKVLKIDLK